jgi:catechol 2,3-dioxygenase-like lactoylglutathione lyase family enzyme
MWENASAAVRLPAQDLDRARAFYRDVLGLEPAEEREGGLRYVLGSTEFAIFESGGAARGEFTQMAIYVDDVEAVVAALSERGAEFETLDFPGMRTVEGIADIDGNYPSKGSGERAAWLRDSEGNMLGFAELVP